MAGSNRDRSPFRVHETSFAEAVGAMSREEAERQYPESFYPPAPASSLSLGGVSAPSGLKAAWQCVKGHLYRAFHSPPKKPHVGMTSPDF